MNLVSSIQEAAKKISTYIYCTPLEYSPYISHISGAHVYLKCEHLQHTGSFKFRGALNKILSLTDVQRKQGVIAASTGNHGLAVAQAARSLQTEATIYLPQSASEFKKEAILLRGADIQYVAGDCLDAEIAAKKCAERQGKIYISPYNDYEVIAGQGTIGLELLNQSDHLDAVFIAVGGGGLISGVGSYLKQYSPNTKVIACWPSAAPAMYECLKAGEIIAVNEKSTLSEATAGNVEPGSVTFEICQQVIDESILVSEQEIAQAMQIVAAQEHWITEGSAGVVLAAFLKEKERFKDKKVAILICGRNITVSQLIKAIS